MAAAAWGSRGAPTGTGLCCSATVTSLSTRTATRIAVMGEVAGGANLGLGKVAQCPCLGVVQEIFQPQ